MKFEPVQRREFITLLGGAAAAWPLAARAQQPDRIRRVAVLSQFAESDPEAQGVMAFRQRLQQLGWAEGHNIQFEIRWGAGDVPRYREYAVELVAHSPDVILASAALIVELLQRQTRRIPIVFAGTIDPVGGGLVASLARPGGNTTGFTGIEYVIGAKWLQLLREITPGVNRIAVVRNTTIAGSGQFGAIQAAAPSNGVELRPIDPLDLGELERAVTTFAQPPNGGMIVTLGGLQGIHRSSIITTAARHRLPAVYPSRTWVAAGGLISYGPVATNLYVDAAGYVDRILKGEKPADLPVQAPTKFQTVLNMKTAKGLGLTVPDIVLVRADEVIE